MIKPPDDALQLQRAINRAQWSIIQTGLITTGLALFGVYVLASRINNVLVMDLYFTPYLPVGPWIAGTIAGSGYAAASWWSGLRVRGRLLLIVLALQLVAYFLAQYAQFGALGVMSRATHEPMGFLNFFQYSTLHFRFGSDGDILMQPMGNFGYVLRAIEIVMFSLGAFASAFVLVGKRRCEICGGVLCTASLGSIPAWSKETTWPALCELARAGDVKQFAAMMQDHGARSGDAAIEACLISCPICGAGWIAPSEADRVGRLQPAYDEMSPAAASFVTALSAEPERQRNLSLDSADMTT